VAAVATLGLYISFTQDLQSSAAVIAELERLSGVLNPESHEAGVSITELWGKLAAMGANAAAVLASVLSLLGSTSEARTKSHTQDSQDNRSIWDEQN